MSIFRKPDPPDWVVAGLGNPGEEYAHTRHNAGFDGVDELAQQAGSPFWKSESGALAARVSLAGQDVLLVKPQSFMNTSGGPLSKLLKLYGVGPDKLIVIHDELDIDPGTIRVKQGGGHAGHNGLKSIEEKLGTRDWLRIRIGIGRPPGRMPTADYVLKRPRGDEEELFCEAVHRGTEAVPFLIEHGLVETQNRFN